MMVTFVSQCEKKALKKTRRVLDAFANRIGDNTWQTIITEEGLKAVKKLLRKTATKNTAVSCHWIRSRSRSQFLWVVGNRNKFNDQGFVPVNYTEKDILNNQFENDWKYLPVIKSLTAFVGLFHDWGKSSALFQEKLNPKSGNRYKGDPLRHEWITCLLLRALIRHNGGYSDEQWLTDLIKGEVQETKIIEIAKNQEKKPLYNLPSAAKIICWLILAHHRLPVADNLDKWRDNHADNIEIMLKRITKSWGYENRYDEDEYKKRLDSCFSFPKGLMLESGGKWRKEVQKHASRLLNNLNLIQEAYDDGSYRSILHHTRLCLMLGDHYYSSQKEADKKWKEPVSLYANSDHSGYRQKLDEHLFHVAKTAINIAHNLPVFEKQLPRTDDIRFLRRSSSTLYRWQDKAVEQINRWKSKENVEKCGFFAVNMASTGCGKTVANAKVMRALSEDGQSLRYVLALGLRTLTLQTGDEYRERIGLDDTELAVLIGSKAVIDLHKQAKKDEQSESLASSGSESSLEALMDEDIDFDCDIPEEKLSTVLSSEKDRKFLHAPVLACTIDHMMGATETTRGGRFILPSLRLMSSDLVIDEIDDFTGADLIAIGRLIHLAGMLGRKVMISSATIPPDMAEGYYNAYRSGWSVYNKMHDASNNVIGCAWIDEFNTKVNAIKVSDLESQAYEKHHKEYIKHRISKLKQQKPKRKAGIIKCRSAMEDCEFELDETKQESYFNLIKDATIAKHDLN
ncbi:MAG: type I-F CRISPR-associated helicase Cas3f, partial [Proteobacteria bacterium]|nr:type I-F CRISPR-associated helicase Cas3f [Pseudomonadota bacterium]